MSKNDEKIMRLKKTIEERKAELGEKKSFTPKTSCSLEFEGQRYNLHATNDYSTLAYILCKLHAIEMAAGDLNIYAGAILICGYPVSDWVADLKSKMEVVARLNSLADEKWIPVTERLPETGVDVLVMFPHNMAVASRDMGEWVVNSGDGWCTDVNISDDEKEPTHWMPLPEPPQEET